MSETVTNITPHFEFDNSFAREMDGFFIGLDADQAPSPSLVLLNRKLAINLGLDPAQLAGEKGLAVFAGNLKPDGAEPLAQAYAGHQFGMFSPSLGDGRALLLGEIIDTEGNRRDIQLKGSGRTVFSRNGDGKAALGPVLREYLFSEAMHALGIPTTRSLAAVTTGENVYREKPLRGAVLTRVASSHLRVGTFQFFAARQDLEKVRKLADYTISRHDPDIADHPDKYMKFLDRVIARQTELVAKWMGVGFIHGVMNTDNTTISGETIDYGPCAFLDAYHPDTVFSSIDDFGRYAYKMQPMIVQWNLARLAESIAELIVPDNREMAIGMLTERIQDIPNQYESLWLKTMLAKLGIVSTRAADDKLVNRLLDLMATQKADFTRTFRLLASAAKGDDGTILSVFEQTDDIQNWLADWHLRLNKEAVTDPVPIMNANNPVYIPRNHVVEDVIKKASDEHDMGSFEHFLDVLQRPYEEQSNALEFETGAPSDFGPHITYCGT